MWSRFGQIGAKWVDWFENMNIALGGYCYFAAFGEYTFLCFCLIEDIEESLLLVMWAQIWSYRHRVTRRVVVDAKAQPSNDFKILIYFENYFNGILLFLIFIFEDRKDIQKPRNGVTAKCHRSRHFTDIFRFYHHCFQVRFSPSRFIEMLEPLISAVKKLILSLFIELNYFDARCHILYPFDATLRREALMRCRRDAFLDIFSFISFRWKRDFQVRAFFINSDDYATIDAIYHYSRHAHYSFISLSG